MSNLTKFPYDSPKNPIITNMNKFKNSCELHNNKYSNSSKTHLLNCMGNVNNCNCVEVKDSYEMNTQRSECEMNSMSSERGIIDNIHLLETIYISETNSNFMKMINSGLPCNKKIIGNKYDFTSITDSEFPKSPKPIFEGIVNTISNEENVNNEANINTGIYYCN